MVQRIRDFRENPAQNNMTGTSAYQFKMKHLEQLIRWMHFVFQFILTN